MVFRRAGSRAVLRYLFIDMNSYFASCEQQMRPELRGRPVAVAPMTVETTSCIAASYEAKAFGVKTGTRVADARRLCPGIRIVPARPDEYIRLHHRIVAAVDRCIPVEKVMSIDEMVCRLDRNEQSPAAATALAARIKDQLCRDVGPYLTCSIGVAPNRLLAKVAADMHKPDGLTLLTDADIPGRLFELKLTDLPGIGPRMNERLRKSGVTTVRRLCELDAAALGRIWGSRVNGSAWFRTLRGEDLPPRETRRRQVGHSQVLPPDWRNDRDARIALVRLLHKAAARLRHVGFAAESIRVSVTLQYGGKWKAHRDLPPTQDTLTLVRALNELWRGKPPARPAKVGVVLADLVPAACVTRSLFETDDRLDRLAAAMDAVNRKFGRYSVCLGGMHEQRDRHATRIAFHTIPDLSLPDG
jgi:DNA polymerase-4